MYVVLDLIQRVWGKVRSLFQKNSHESEAMYPMTAREFEALKGIARKGGTAHPAWIAARLGVSNDYVRMLGATLMREDYVDVTEEGLYVLTAKGKRELFARGVLKEWQAEDLELLPPEVRRTLAHELADEIKKEVGGAIGDLVAGLPRGRRGAVSGMEGDEIKIGTDYSFLPSEGTQLEHNLGTRAEKEQTGKADIIEEAARALRRLGKNKS